MIIIVNKRNLKPSTNSVDIYIGRPSALGNPFELDRDGNRDQVCDLYAQTWQKRMTNSAAMRAEFSRVVNSARQGDVRLVCWCAPYRCHGETIKARVEEVLTEDVAI